MSDNTVTRPGHTVSYWKVETISLANKDSIPNWIIEKLSIKDIIISAIFDYTSFTNRLEVSYKTFGGYKVCNEGDYLLYDNDEMYSLTENDFNAIYRIEGEANDNQ